MASNLILHTVKGYAEWKKVFVSSINSHKSSGKLSAQVYRDASDHNETTTLNKWDSLVNAKKFGHSPELKADMQKAGVVGALSIS